MRRALTLSVFLLLSFVSILAQESSGEEDYTRVRGYNVSMTVEPNNVYHVIEEISVHFAEEHHGIYRYVPYVYSMFGKTYHVEITDVQVNGAPFTLDEENDNILIKMGSEDETVTGDKSYNIHYTIRNVDDRVSTCDMFYHSVIGDYFELPIDRLSFKISFKKPLPDYAKDSLQVFSGPAGETGNQLNARVGVSKNTISGEVRDIPNENAVTVRLRLPEGYYVGEDTVTSDTAYFFLFLSVLVLIAIFYYEFTVKHPRITKQIEFYPPDDMCSAEVGTVIDGTVDKVDLASLIPWFASKGYLRIDEKVKKGLLSKKKYLELTKLKSLPEDTPVYQAKFFEALFSGGDTVSLDDMPDVGEKVQEASNALKDIYVGEKKLTSWHWSVYLFLALAATSTCFFIASLPFKFLDDSEGFVPFFVCCFPAVLGFMFVVYNDEHNPFRKKWIKYIMFAVRFFCMFIVICFYLIIEEEQLVDYEFIILLYLFCFIAVEFSTRLEVNSQYRADLIGKLLGLKEFIETAEEPRLKSLLEDDPQYFYKLLPYAMVFEISDVWADHFKNIQMESPEWYNASDVNSMFMTHSFVSSLSSASNNAIKCMAPQSSGSGGSSYSGGFSGGGSGGGGGGAW